MPVHQLDRNAFARPVVGELIFVVQTQQTRLVVDLDNKLLDEFLADDAFEVAACTRRKRFAEWQRHPHGLRKTFQAVDRERSVLH